MLYGLVHGVCMFLILIYVMCIDLYMESCVSFVKEVFGVISYETIGALLAGLSMSSFLHSNWQILYPYLLVVAKPDNDKFDDYESVIYENTDLEVNNYDFDSHVVDYDIYDLPQVMCNCKVCLSANNMSINSLVSTHSLCGLVPESFLRKFGDDTICLRNCVHKIADVSILLKPCNMFRILLHIGLWYEDFEYVYAGSRYGHSIVNESFTGSYYCNNYNSVYTDVAKNEIDKTMCYEIANGMISEVPNVPSCVHSLGAISKPDGSVRIITDASRPIGLSINNAMSDCMEKFRYIALKDVAKDMYRNCYMNICDIKGAYRHIPVKAAHRTLQGFRWYFRDKARYFVSNSLVFGLADAPYIFDRYTRFIVWCMKCFGVKNTYGYLDDFMTFCASYELSLWAQRLIISILRTVGFFINYNKLISPSQKARYLGIDLCSVSLTLTLPEDKLVKLHVAVCEFLEKEVASINDIQKLVGLLSHCATVVRGGRTFSRRAINMLKGYTDKRAVISLPDYFHQDLLWWKSFVSMFNGVATVIDWSWDNTETIYADASMLGFGARYNNDWLYGIWSDVTSEFYFDHHLAIAPLRNLVSSAQRELWPILIGLVRWGANLKNKRVAIFTDNVAVEIMLKTGRSKDVLCMQWLREIFWISVFYNFEIVPFRISSVENVFCDALSRILGRKFQSKVYEYAHERSFCCLPRC